MNKKKLIIGFSILLLVVIIIIQQKDNFSNFLVNEENIFDKKKELKVFQKELQAHLNIKGEIDFQKEKFLKKKNNYWIITDNNKPLIEIEKKVKEIAKSAGINITSLSSVKYSKITEDILIGETSVVIKSKLKNITQFLFEINKTKPKFYWDNVNIRRKRRNTSDLDLSGKIKFICILENINKETKVTEKK